MAAFAASAVGRDKKVGPVLELAVEVATVEAFPGDGLSEGVQFAEGEAFGEEFGAKGGGLVETAAEVSEGLPQ